MPFAKAFMWQKDKPTQLKLEHGLPIPFFKFNYLNIHTSLKMLAVRNNGGGKIQVPYLYPF